jgi:serine-type anaerobic sulfatase-maturating enzyme
MNTDEPMTVAAATGFHLLAKPTGAVCNLDCNYCFFLSKESLYPGSRFRMSEDLQEAYIRQLLEAHSAAPEVVVAWQGGEPTLMGLEFFRSAIEIEHRYVRPGQTVVNTIQTNGTLIDDAWAAFFKEHDFLVGISIDGPREIHDRYRVDKGGKPTFERVRVGLERLKAHDVEWNVLACVHRSSADQGRAVYRYLRDDLGARFIQLIPIVESAQGPEGVDGGSSLSTTAEAYGQFLIDVFEEWVRHDVGSVFVQMFDAALAHWVGVPGSLCVHEETCGRSLALEHNGDVYSCDHFVEPSFRLGNISSAHMLELVDSPEQRRFGLQKRDGLTQQCRDCDVRFACNGGCPKDRFATSRLGEAGHNYLCAGYELFFRHVDRPMRFMADALRDGRAPASIMSAYAAADKWRARNAPCTCAAGRKWMHCHGA